MFIFNQSLTNSKNDLGRLRTKINDEFYINIKKILTHKLPPQLSKESQVAQYN